MANTMIGELSEKYEVGNRGPGFISNGDKWDPGGDSYGSYQLATKVGTLQGYLKLKNKYTEQLNKYKIKSAEFNALWKSLAKLEPEEFKQSQFDYVKTISYIPCRKYADKLGFKDTLAVNSALFSISNQHGRWKWILDRSIPDPKGSTEADQINNLYDARAYYLDKIGMGSGKWASMKKNRTVLERKDCLALIQKSPN